MVGQNGSKTVSRRIAQEHLMEFGVRKSRVRSGSFQLLMDIRSWK